MKLFASLFTAAVLVAAPAFAGDVEIVQEGAANWIAVNQYNRVNSAITSQTGTSGGYSSNYGAFAQTGASNSILSRQTSSENLIGANQYGDYNYAGAFQSGPKNSVGITQNALPSGVTFNRLRR